MDYAPAVLWITRAGLAVDYGPAGPVDYARGARCGLVECGGWLRPHTPQAGLSPARSASCGCSYGAHERGW